MSAPALILLAQGTVDPYVEQVYHALRHQLQSHRPALSIHLAFTDTCPPTGPQVVGTLANRGVEEIVMVPLDLSRVCQPSDEMQQVLMAARNHRPDVRITMARPIGPAVELLNILDIRLRNALSAANATELDGLVLSNPASGDTRGTGLIARRARQWATHHRLPVVVAYGDGSGTDVASAVHSLRHLGRRHIAVGSVYIAPTGGYRQQLEMAMESGALAVSAPIGAEPRLAELAMGRYAFAAMAMLDDESGAQTQQSDQAL